jgi:hypothetical protein
MVAFVNLGSYYLIGLPAGILLGFVAHLNVQVIMSTKLYGLSTLISRASIGKKINSLIFIVFSFN